jgi:hypothetical protein
MFFSKEFLYPPGTFDLGQAMKPISPA